MSNYLGVAVVLPFFMAINRSTCDDGDDDLLLSILQVLTQKLGRSKCALQETLLRLSRSNMHKAGQVRHLSEHSCSPLVCRLHSLSSAAAPPPMYSVKGGDHYGHYFFRFTDFGLATIANGLNCNRR